jgi:hypothetical protein
LVVLAHESAFAFKLLALGLNVGGGGHRCSW